MKKEKKFDMSKEPNVPNWFWYTVEKVGSWIFAGPFGTKTKVNRINCEGLKPPYLIFSNHASFVDFANNIIAMNGDKSCWVASVEEFIGIREFLFNAACVIPKRKFTNDVQLIKKIVRATKKGMCMTIYPEARFSLAGINEDIGSAIGKMAKMCKVPIIVMNQKGNFLRSPQWNKRPYRDIHCEVDFIQVINQQEVETLSADEIQKKVEEAFIYDDYKWQIENNYRIKSKYRAHNIHKVLYKCPICGSEHHMNSKHTKLWCTKCNAEWEMNELGQLHCLNKEETFVHVPDWYRWERDVCIKEVNEGKYFVKEKVRVEHLVNAKKGFVVKGEVTMIHDINGYHFEGTLNDGTPFTFTKAPLSTRSIHIEYDYKGKGDALDIVYNDETYFVFPLNNQSQLTKYNFSTEAIFFRNSKE